MNTNEHEKKSGKSFLQNNWQCFVGLALFIIFAGILIYNTWPQKYPELQELLSGLKQQTSAVKGTYIVKQETTTKKDVPVYDVWGRIITPSITTKEISSTTKTSDLPESYVISKEDMEKALTAVAYAARKEAQEEYDKNFATLLTILTIFGIAWPLIIALFQFKFSEKELAKIEKANDNAEESLKQASESKDKAEESLKQASKAKDDAEKSLAAIAETNMRIYRYNGDTYYQLATTDAAKYSDWSIVKESIKVDILYKFFFSIDSYIRATLAEKDNNACRRTVYAKINNMCDWIEKIIPNLKSQQLMIDFNFLVTFCADISDNGNEKTKIMERLGKIASELEEKFSEPEILDQNEK